ncbi:PE-PGRS family protein PE_PGRS4-like [Palaemon carinicauda]|uniref:PE-PGRS family protein PE_PGRS4-like n=1 Tax=Palaemon carinicauda TaxID=392227 RepID=UPI0035B622C0
MAFNRLAVCVLLSLAATSLKGVSCDLAQSYEAPTVSGGLGGGSSFGGLGGSTASNLGGGSAFGGSVSGNDFLTGGYGGSNLGSGSLTGIGGGSSTLGNLEFAHISGLTGSSGGIFSGLTTGGVGNSYNSGLAGSSTGILGGLTTTGLGGLTNTGLGNVINTGLGGISGGNSLGNLGIFPTIPRPVIPILEDQREGPYANGVYRFNYATGDGIVRQEQGYPEGGMVSQQGTWSFTHPDGTPTTVNFVADANGFRVNSNRVPPTPAHALAQIEKARLEDAYAQSENARLEDALASGLVGTGSQILPGSGLSLRGSQFTGSNSLISNSGVEGATYGSQFNPGFVSGSGTLLSESGSLSSGIQTPSATYGLP